MHYFSPFYSPFGPGLMIALLPFLLIVALWTVLLKGFALWYAARGNQKWWFIALLVINTLGVLEIIYLIWFRPEHKQGDVREEPLVHTSSTAQ